MGGVTRILVVDDEAHIRDVIEYAFEQEGYTVALAESGEAALASLETVEPDLIVLDVMLPGLDGLDLCQRIRKKSQVAILFLSARGEEMDRVLGLNLGGDDYLSKPFSPRELVARARAILRRSVGSEGAVATLRHGAIVLDRERHACTVGTETLSLTATEFLILTALLARPGVVFSRGQLMEQVLEGHTTERTIDTHIKRIRAKFREVGAEDPIKTVHGVGYSVGSG